uniref:Alpha-tocopherol transfer protein-like n=1 Tax=Cacopsylla melanoneura TaxID=428564 RepID=A0A8D8W023_9HEMI
MEIAKMKLDMYYSQRRAVPDIYDNCDPTGNELVKSYKTVYTITLPTLTSDGSSVTILKLRNPDPAMYNPCEPIKRINMIYDLMVHKATLTSKTHIIYDYAEVTNAHVTQVNPLVIKTHLDTLKFLPIRLKSVIAINCPKFAEKTYNLMRSLMMSKKLQERVFVYAEGASVLSKHISVDVLPKDYGGQGSYTLEELNDYWQDVLIDNREWFLNENERYSDESKRPADSKYKPNEDTYGVEGSFKKLQID